MPFRKSRGTSHLPEYIREQRGRTRRAEVRFSRFDIDIWVSSPNRIAVQDPTPNANLLTAKIERLMIASIAGSAQLQGSQPRPF